MKKNNESKKKKVVSMKRFRLSFAGVLFSLILIYLVFQGIVLVSRHRVEAYNIGVSESDNVAGSHRGIVLRDEEVYTASRTGFLQLFTMNGNWVGKNTLLLSQDESGDILSHIRSLYYGHSALSYESRIQIQKTLREGMNRYDPRDFSTAIRAKDDLESVLMNRLLEEGEAPLAAYLDNLSYRPVYAEEAGFFLIWQDGFEERSASSLTPDDFKTDTYSVIRRSSGTLVSAGDFLYKQASDNKFTLSFLLTDAEKASLGRRKTLSVEMEDGNVLDGTFSLHEADGASIGTITFSKYGVNYVSERFVNFRILDTAVRGFKIPESAILHKDFFIVPAAYITEGLNGKKGVLKKGDSLSEFIEATVYSYNSDLSANFVASPEVCYIYSDDLQSGDVLLAPGNGKETCTLDLQAAVEGCYQINNGYCLFRPIVRIQNSLDTMYVIISDRVNGGLKAYDRIVFNAAELTENEIIFE